MLELKVADLFEVDKAGDTPTSLFKRHLLHLNMRDRAVSLSRLRSISVFGFASSLFRFDGLQAKCKSSETLVFGMNRPLFLFVAAAPSCD